MRSVLVPDTIGALGYDLADDGFRVILSRRLPDLLAGAVPRLVDDFSATGVAALDAIAVHPGGRAIVTAVQQCLGLRDEQLAATREVMRTPATRPLRPSSSSLSSSPPRCRPAGRGLVIGFGPGLTVELLEITWGC